MKIKVQIMKCTHETRYGVDHYISPVKKNENPVDVIDAIAKDCGYDEGETDEFFGSDFEEIIIDTDDFEVVVEMPEIMLEVGTKVFFKRTEQNGIIRDAWNPHKVNPAAFKEGLPFGYTVETEDGLYHTCLAEDFEVVAD